MSMDIDKCRLESEHRWSEVNVKFQKIQDDISVINNRLNKQASMVEDIQQLGTSVSILANNMKAMLDEQQKQNARIQTLEQKPAKRWDMIVDKIILLAVAGVMAYVLTQVGLPG